MRTTLPIRMAKPPATRGNHRNAAGTRTLASSAAEATGTGRLFASIMGERSLFRSLIYKGSQHRQQENAPSKRSLENRLALGNRCASDSSVDSCGSSSETSRAALFLADSNNETRQRSGRDGNYFSPAHDRTYMISRRACRSRPVHQYGMHLGVRAAAI